MATTAPGDRIGACTHSGSGEDLSMDGFEDYTRVQHVLSCIGA